MNILTTSSQSICCLHGTVGRLACLNSAVILLLIPLHMLVQVGPVDRGSPAPKNPSLNLRRSNFTPSLQSGISHIPEPSVIDNLRLNEVMTESSNSSSRNYDDEYEYDILYECQRG